MSEPTDLNTRLLTAGAALGLAASIFWPFRLPSRLLYLAGAVLLFTACHRMRARRSEFAAARKYLAAFAVLAGLSVAISTEQIARLLQLGLAAFSYFAVTLLCAGCKAVQDGRPASERQTEMPGVVGQFEVCAGVFAVCQAVALGLPGLRSWADLAAMAGFAAAVYMRGIDFINCPTTTLSMIDSSIGGKTAVDLGDTKNVVGAFWQPKLVIVDADTLATLPRRHFVNGLAEAVKAGLLADPELFGIFESGDVDAEIDTIIYRSLKFKKGIVEQDETEQGARKALNFGHTIGHGIEAVKGIKGRRKTGLYHGECVALGMLPMIESKALRKRTRAVYRRLGLPIRAGFDKEAVYAEMLHDKKAQGGQITVIKVPGLGCWRAENIPVESLRALLGLEDKA